MAPHFDYGSPIAVHPLVIELEETEQEQKQRRSTSGALIVSQGDSAIMSPSYLYLNMAPKLSHFQYKHFSQTSTGSQ